MTQNKDKMPTSIKITIIICITLILIIGIITYGIVINEIYESPYEQCLKTCQYSDKIECAKTCSEEFKEAIEILADKLTPLIERALE